MIEYDLNELDRIATTKRLEREKIEKETEELNRLLSMPFHLRIQDPSQEHLLKQLEENQREAFFARIKKSFKELEKEKEDLFAEYMTEFLNGKIENIIEFFKSRGYEYKSDPVVKKAVNYIKKIGIPKDE